MLWPEIRKVGLRQPVDGGKKSRVLVMPGSTDRHVTALRKQN